MVLVSSSYIDELGQYGEAWVERIRWGKLSVRWADPSIESCRRPKQKIRMTWNADLLRWFVVSMPIDFCHSLCHYVILSFYFSLNLSLVQQSNLIHSHFDHFGSIPMNVYDQYHPISSGWLVWPNWTFIFIFRCLVASWQPGFAPWAKARVGANMYKICIYFIHTIIYDIYIYTLCATYIYIYLHIHI